MSNPCCPFCGAEHLSGPGGANLPMFACGTLPKTLMRSDDCYEREISSLRTEIATLLNEARELNEEMKSWRTYFKERLDAWRKTKVGWDEYWESLNTEEQQRLKSLGEL